MTVSETSASIKFRHTDGKKVQAEYPAKTTCEVTLQGANDDSEIPFLSGAIYGTTFYLTEGKEYIATATLKAEDEDGDIWSVDIEKANTIKVDRDQKILFQPQIGVSEFNFDGEDLYLGAYANDKLKTENSFGQV